MPCQSGRCRRHSLASRPGAPFCVGQGRPPQHPITKCNQLPLYRTGTRSLKNIIGTKWSADIRAHASAAGELYADNWYIRMPVWRPLGKREEFVLFLGLVFQSGDKSGAKHRFYPRPWHSPELSAFLDMCRWLTLGHVVNPVKG